MTQQCHNTSTRGHSLKLSMPSSRLDIRRNSFAVRAIALALECAIDLYTSGTVDAGMNTKDSKAALNTIMDSHVHGNYHQVITRIRPLLLKFHNIKCHISLGWILNHAGIEDNEQADILAKKALKDSPISAKGQLSLPACKKLVAKHTKRLWQQRWDRSTTRRVTYDLIHAVGMQMVFPRDRCCAISYCRLLLDDSTLNVPYISSEQA